MAHHASSPQISIILPTYNESQNIISVIESIRENIPEGVATQTIVVDDNSPDGTARIVEEYVSGLKKFAENTIDIVHRRAKNGLSSAILHGIRNAKGDTIVVMDSDLSHPPQVIPKMLDLLKHYQCDLVIASRYVTGGRINGWTLKRKLISRVAALIAKKGLNVKAMDPISGFFAFKKSVVAELSFDALGYKLLLEMLVKAKGITVREIPYTFEDRKLGSSKLGWLTILDYCRSVWKLYRYGKIRPATERRTSVRFLSKAARFFTVGASGVGVNYLVSTLFASGPAEMWYIHANIMGIVASISTNFILNKIWTFEDRVFSTKRTLSQFGKFGLLSSLGALVQIAMVFWLVESHDIAQPLALILAIGTAAFSNFLLNKRLTFNERLWD